MQKSGILDYFVCFESIGLKYCAQLVDYIMCMWEGKDARIWASKTRCWKWVESKVLK